MRQPIRALLAAAVALAIAALRPAAAGAQTDYYNTDRGRPFHIEDAYPVERRAFEIQAAPLRLERAVAGVYHWSLEPEIAYGILPRTHVELGLPLSFIDAAGARRSGIAGLHLSVLHNLNVETSIPAFAVAARALLPVGGLAGDDTYVSFTGIGTRTFPWARFHVNAEYTVGEEALASRAVEASRWSAGLAVDRTLPLRSLLFGGEVTVQQPLESAADPVVAIGAGTRWQLLPRWAIDAGFGRRLTGGDRGWYVTFGSAYAFGLPWSP